MKKLIFLSLTAILSFGSLSAQETDQQLRDAVTKLEKAKTVKEFEKLAGEFEKLTNSKNPKWLPYYYAAFCNAKIGWLSQYEGEIIEPYADKAETQITTALSYLDTSTQKKELSEVQTVQSMINRARVFINPMTYGPKFGPTAYLQMVNAKKANPENPRATFLEAWDKFYAPSAYGGDKKKAKELLETALSQLNTEKPATGYPHWGKTEVETLLKSAK
jgi:hypothetical protein